MHFFTATVKSFKSDDTLQSTLTLVISGADYDRVVPVGKRVQENLMIGVFSEGEFLQWGNEIKEHSNDEL